MSEAPLKKKSIPPVISSKVCRGHFPGSAPALPEGVGPAAGTGQPLPGLAAASEHPDFDLFPFISRRRRSPGLPLPAWTARLPCALAFVLGTALIYYPPASQRTSFPGLPGDGKERNAWGRVDATSRGFNGASLGEKVPGDARGPCTLGKQRLERA